jgi:hypothetical protein
MPTVAQERNGEHIGSESCAESGLCVPLLRAVAHTGFVAADVAWGGHPLP